MTKILLIDDEPSALKLLSKMVESLGYEYIAVTDPREGLDLIRREKITIILTDLMMPEIDGLEVLRRSLKLNKSLQVILVTSVTELEPAVEAIKSGAADYIQKPLDVDQIQAVLVRITKNQKLIEENRQLKAKLEHYSSHYDIIGRSESMIKIFKTIERVAKTNASVLIHGESGTGKEMIANAIHKMSDRSHRNFVGVDCVSIPKELFESEIFGYEKGAFTGAQSSRKGLLAEANSGTFFFDEVTEVDYAVQAKLLRVLQERKYRRVGGRELLDLDIRVLAATRRDPLEAVEQGIFREDLYYRLNVLPIELPALRDRREDIPLMVESFIEDYRQEYNTEMEMSPEALLKIQSYSWPGNVRELKNIVTRLCIMAVDHRIVEEDLPANITQYNRGNISFEWLSNLKFKEAKEKWLEGFEVKYLEHVLNRHDGNISEAARNSGVNRKTFQRLMTKHNLRENLK
ncbi:MAG: sigma-54 dependent transcriptional regulator [Lentisphaeraceae bacterium]|nr:sigma-54 dependent transcriptional regulator [Lentisphaeraceae bacterium]